MTSPSIWNPGGTAVPSVNADLTLQGETFTATAGQTVFTLTLFQYQTASGSLLVFVNGADQVLTTDYTETSNTSITFTSGLELGTQVVIRAFVGTDNTVAAEASATAAAASAVAASASEVAAALSAGVIAGTEALCVAQVILATAAASAAAASAVDAAASAIEAAIAAGGGLTAISVATTNGFAGTSGGGVTPVITLTTSITGLLKGNGTALSAAAATTDYVAPSAYASTNGLTLATARLLGRTTASTGAAEEISVGAGLSLSAGTLASTAITTDNSMAFALAF